MTRKYWVALIGALSLAFTSNFAAPPPELAGKLREANARVLEALAAVERSPANERPALGARVAELLEQRSKLLVEIVRQAPREALQLAFPPELIERFRRALPESAPSLESRGRWRGSVDYLVFDGPDLKTSWSRIRIHAPQGDFDVHFAGPEPPDLKSGDVLEVEGVAIDSHIAASGGSVQLSTQAVTCTPLGEQRVAVILATFPGVTPPAVSPGQVYDSMFGATGRSLDSYWREVSYHKAWATGTVLGWYVLDQTYTCDRYYDLLAAAIRAADPDIDFRNYNRIVVIFPDPGGCSWAGLSNVGCRTYSSSDGSFASSASWMLASYFANRDQAVKLTVHELGHGLGLMHSRSRDFGPEAIGPVGAAGTISEYGDVFSAMGSWNFGHYTAEQKLKLGWLSNENVITVQGSGEFNLLPLEVASSGLQALKVQRGSDTSGNWLWIEFRQPTGQFDSTLPSQVFSGALVHYRDSLTGSYTDLIDFTTSTSSFADPALLAGSSWSDPYTNLTLSVSRADSAGLQLVVNFGPSACLRSTPSVTISPPNASALPGSQAQFTVTVTNRDSQSCGSSTFSFELSPPAGWLSTLSPDSVVLSPGQSSSVMAAVTVPPNTPAGTYPVGVTALRSGGSEGAVSAGAAVTVAPPAPLTIVLGYSISSASRQSTLVVEARVSRGAEPVSRAAVVFTLMDPLGNITTRKALTDSSGLASWTVKLGSKSPSGSWTVSAAASSGGETACSPPLQFVIP